MAILWKLPLYFDCSTTPLVACRLGPAGATEINPRQVHRRDPGPLPSDGIYPDQREDVRSRAKSGLRARPLPCRRSANNARTHGAAWLGCIARRKAGFRDPIIRA